MDQNQSPASQGGPSEFGLLDTILQRAADRLDDLRPHVMTRFYDRFPEARAIFETESAGHSEKLEGDMVEQTLYCLMTWAERPTEIRIVLQSTVPHHEAALRVPEAPFGGFVDAVIETIAGTIPAEAVAEFDLLASVRAGLRRATSDAAALFGSGDSMAAGKGLAAPAGRTGGAQ